MKFLVIGHARHGKDTVARMICGWALTHTDDELKFVSSSLFCAERVVIPYLEKRGILYESVQQCYDDRHNWRGFWYDAICEYCKDDPARVVRELLAENDIYVGLRQRAEFFAARNLRLFDHVIWVEDPRKLLEPSNSMNLEPWMADFHIVNSGDFDYLAARVAEVMETIYR